MRGIEPHATDDWTRGYRFEQELSRLRQGSVEVLLDPAMPTEFLVL